MRDAGEAVESAEPTDSTEELIRRHIDAFNRHDVEALLGCLSADAVWITGQYTVRGERALRELFAGAMAGLLPTLTVESLIVAGDEAAAQLTETYAARGKGRADPIAGFYRVRAGRIVSAKIYREGSADA